MINHPALVPAALAAIITIAMSIGLTGCRSGENGQPEPVATHLVTPTSPNQAVTATTTMIQPRLPMTPIPDPGLVDSADPESVDLVRDADLNAYGHYENVRIADDGTRYLIPLESIEWGGVARDGIPSLDSPAYVGPDRWSQMVYDPDGLVIGVEVNGKYRAYPLQILIWHEIVNETFDGKHLLVTY